MMMKIRTLMGLIGSLALVAGAAVPQFEEVPTAANKALKAVKGKPIRTGMVFVNGRYVKPPYVLMRSGTALFANYSTQISGQVVPWKTFLATQGGAAAQKPAAPAPRRTAQSVDDLFSDAPPPPSTTPASTSASAAEEVDFTSNAQSDRLLKRINDQRSYYDRRLREGYVIFFGSRYAPVSVDPRSVRALMAMLPEAIRDSSDGADLYGRMRAKGFPYMTREICDELVENRVDYSRIVERRKEMEKADELNRLLQ
jgi:hypothetical protein